MSPGADTAARSGSESPPPAATPLPPGCLDRPGRRAGVRVRSGRRFSGESAARRANALRAEAAQPALDDVDRFLVAVLDTGFRPGALICGHSSITARMSASSCGGPAERVGGGAAPRAERERGGGASTRRSRRAPSSARADGRVLPRGPPAPPPTANALRSAKAARIRA